MEEVRLFSSDLDKGYDFNQGLLTLANQKEGENEIPKCDSVGFIHVCNRFW